MRWIPAAAAAFAIFPATAQADRRPMLYDAVALNIGVNCQWQAYCMKQQRTAMKHALGYVSAEKPPQWKIHLCNRNASRGGVRVDWIGYNHCIRNLALKPPQSRSRKRSRR
jgi:hypothetical protein